VFERHSALAGVLGREPTESLVRGGAPAAGDALAAEGGSVKLGEVRGFALVQVAAFPNTWSALANVVEEILGALPEKAGQSSGIRDRLLFRTGSEQFWVVSGTNEDPAEALQRAVRADIGTVTSLSHSRTRIFVEGPGARRVLGTGIAIDLDPLLFPIGAVALTGAHHTPVVLHRVGAERYELYVLRTFAVWIWDWLTDAAPS
jgi:heterotetrameric sarcosine oxidase gamma subunit